MEELSNYVDRSESGLNLYTYIQWKTPTKETFASLCKKNKPPSMESLFSIDGLKPELTLALSMMFNVDPTKFIKPTNVAKTAKASSVTKGNAWTTMCFVNTMHLELFTAVN